MLSKPFLILLAAVLGGGLAWMFKPTPPPAAHNGGGRPSVPVAMAPQINISDVSTQAVAARAKLGGFVEPRYSVRLTAQGPGRVAYIGAREGETVAPGQVVVGLDEDALWPDYRAAWAGVASEMAAQQNAQVQLYNRMHGPQTAPMGGAAQEGFDRSTIPFFNLGQQMFNQAVPFAAPFMGPLAGSAGQFAGPQIQSQSQAQRSFPSMNNYRSEYERQMAAMIAAQSRIDSMEARMRDRRAIAPYPAVVLAKHVNIGDVVQPGQPLMDLADTNQLDVRIDVPTRLVIQLKLGETIPVTLEGNVNVQAQVAQIFPAASQTQRTVTVKLALPAGTQAAPGMYATALISEATSPGELLSTSPAVPTSAVVYRGSLPSVFVVANNGAVELRVVRLGETVGDRVIVLSGLKPGDKVVTAPGPNMRSGDSVFGKPYQS